MKRLATWVLVPAITVAAVFGPLWGVCLATDINGDRVVDILDVQALVADTLTANGTASDLNADGAINVLDLQRLLGGKDQAQLPQQKSDSSSPDDATLPHLLRAPVLVLTQNISVADLLDSRKTTDASTFPLGDDVGPATRARLLLRALTPHAPPLYA